MTAPKISTISRGGSRLYVHPETRSKVPGVTSVVGMLPKDFLKFWAAKETAQAAVDNLGEIVGIALRDPDAAVDFLKRAPDRDVRKAAMNGDEVHDLFESMAKGEEPRRLHPDLEPHAKNFREFLAEFEPEFLFLEETVWSETHGYAGSFDAIARIMGELVILDWKTTRSGVHAEVSLQETAYAKADYIIRPDGTRVPMPKIEAGGVLHSRPEGWQLVPARVDDEVFGYFLHLLNGSYKWQKEIKDTVLGEPINKNPNRTKRTPTPRARKAAAQ